MSKKWYALQLRSNRERTTASFLADRCVEFFLPTYRILSKRTDRRVTVIKPLFTGYVFVKVDYRGSERIQALKAPGAVRLVGFGNDPSPIDEEIIESLKILVGSNEDLVRPHPLVKVGSRVQVTDGPFAGAAGTLSETEDKKAKLVVEIDFLGRAVSVPISRDQVTPCFD